MPNIVRFMGGDQASYEYLAKTTVNFPRRHALTAEWTQAGFREVRSQPLMLGSIALHVGVKRRFRVRRLPPLHRLGLRTRFPPFAGHEVRRGPEDQQRAQHLRPSELAVLHHPFVEHHEHHLR